ncbi:MAG: sulfate ABC transporter permease subunit CysW [Planctomycetia bacterium]|jgi:sulfate transport system permease protein
MSTKIVTKKSTRRRRKAKPARAAYRPTTEPRWVRWSLTTIAVCFLAFFLLLPLLAVFSQALAQGVKVYWASLVESDAISAISLTLLTAIISVPAAALFGVAAAWAIAKFNFRGKNLLITLIDLPFTVSPVVVGLIFVMLFGRNGWLSSFSEHGIQVLFAVPGVVIVTMFVTFPFVARELIPLMESQGTEEEEAARVLGASGLQTFWHVTLPNIKWGLLYGVILCNARAMGEFGAVSVVSGCIRGQTNSMPLHVELLYNEYNHVGAFAVASLLAVLALVTLVVKTAFEWQESRQQTSAEEELFELPATKSRKVRIDTPH